MKASSSNNCSYIRVKIVMILCFFIVLPSNILTASEKSIESIQNEIEAIDLQLKFLKIKVDNQKNKSRNIEKKIESSKQQIKDLELQIEQLTTNQKNIISQIQKLEKDNLEYKQQQKELLDRFRKRLIHLHKIKQNTLISSVLLAKNLNSFLNRYQMVKYLLETDKALIDELKEKSQKLKTVSLNLKEKNTALEQGKIEISEKQKKLKKEQASLTVMLNTILLEKNQYLKKEKNLANSKKQLEKQIQESSKIVSKPNFDKELAISPNSVAVDSENIKSISAVPANTPAKNTSEASTDAAKLMDFTWPISKDYVDRYTEKGDDNAIALLIKPVADAEVVAVAKGKVLYKGNINGLGDVIILGHQRGFSSVYAKLNDVWVGLNEVVNKGDVIGKIDGGGNEFLHFEIRFGGKKQPPLTLLPKP